MCTTTPFFVQSAAADGGSQGPSFALPWLAQISSGEADAEAGAAGGVGPGGAPHIPCLFYRLLLPALPPVPPAVLQKIQVGRCVREEREGRSAYDPGGERRHHWVRGLGGTHTPCDLR